MDICLDVRGPSAEFHPGVNPSRLPLYVFADNVAHSNGGAGFATYPGAGYNPVQEATFVGMQSYRNRGSGLYLRNSGNLTFDGGVVSDNRVGFNMERAHTVKIQNLHVGGETPSFVALATGSGSTSHCPTLSNPAVIGIELHSTTSGGMKKLGTTISNVSFANFGGDGICEGSAALSVDPREYYQFFDPRSSVEALEFDTNSTVLNLCPAVENDMNIALRDVDGSLVGTSQQGFVISNTTAMTTFAAAPSCTTAPPDDASSSCALVCPNTCFRTLSLAVSSYTPDDLQLVVQDGSGKSIALKGYFDYRDWDPYWNTWSKFTRRFFVTLPTTGASSSSSYTGQFVVNNHQVVWPLFVERSWEDVDGCGPEFALTIDDDTLNANYSCQQLIVNGNAEGNSTEGWWHTAGGIETVAGGANGTAFALSNQFRSYSSFGIAQYLDTRCMVVGRQYQLQAYVQLINTTDDNNNPFTCTPGNNAEAPCPEAHVKRRVGTTDPINSFQTIGVMTSWIVEEWNLMQGTWTITEEDAAAGSILLAWHRTPAHVQVILDEMTLVCIANCE
mmetsp:Transcript_6779/g.10293  ORF Transcript_6779/g.10293 Transcript_6779/m.10293 type:complete len:559 (+) Transcript_6779:40-1716(+)